MYYFGVILFKSIAFCLALLPRPLFLLLGAGLGFILRKLNFRGHVIDGNLNIAFPEMSAEERLRLKEKNYRHYGILFLEILRSFYRFDRFLEKYCDLEGEENVQAARAAGKGAFVMTAHLGNWEILTAVGAQDLGVPVTMVTKRLKPEWIHRLVETERSLLRIKMAFEPRTMPTIMRALKKGELVGFVMDQFAGAPVGARVPFFGKPVGSHVALATLALRMNVPVVPAIAIRKADGRYEVRFEPQISLVDSGNKELDIIQNTANYVAHTERWIREYPEQWLWIHRRWKGDLSPLAPNSVGEMLK